MHWGRLLKGNLVYGVCVFDVWEKYEPGRNWHDGSFSPGVVFTSLNYKLSTNCRETPACAAIYFPDDFFLALRFAKITRRVMKFPHENFINMRLILLSFILILSAILLSAQQPPVDKKELYPYKGTFDFENGHRIGGDNWQKR